MEEDWINLRHQLDIINYRIKILDMIQEKLFEMKKLAQRGIDEQLSKKQADNINKELIFLKEQIILLDKENTPLS